MIAKTKNKTKSKNYNNKMFILLLEVFLFCSHRCDDYYPIRVLVITPLTYFYLLFLITIKFN